MRGKSNFENVLASQNCVFGKAGLGFNPQNKQDKFSKNFSKQPVKQPIVKSKQPVVTCFDENQLKVAFYNEEQDHSPSHLKFFLLIFAKDKAQAQA